MLISTELMFAFVRCRLLFFFRYLHLKNKPQNPNNKPTTYLKKHLIKHRRQPWLLEAGSRTSISDRQYSPFILWCKSGEVRTAVPCSEQWCKTAVNNPFFGGHLQMLQKFSDLLKKMLLKKPLITWCSRPLLVLGLYWDF